MARVTFEIGNDLIEKAKSKTSWINKMIVKASQKHLSYINDMNLEIEFTYDEVESMFHHYVEEELDFDLHAYDEFLLTVTDNGIEIDLTELEEDCPPEYELVMNILCGHFGDNVLDDNNILNAKLVMKKMFKKACVEVTPDGIKVIGTLEELKNN